MPNEGAKAPSASKDLWWWDVVGEHVCIYTNIFYMCTFTYKYIYIDIHIYMQVFM